MTNYIVTKKIKFALPPHYTMVGELCKSRKSKVITLSPSGVLCPKFQDKFSKHPAFCANGEMEKPTAEQMLAKTVVSGDIFLTNEPIYDGATITGVTESTSVKIPAGLVEYNGDVTEEIVLDYVNLTDAFGNILTPNQPE